MWQHEHIRYGAKYKIKPELRITMSGVMARVYIALLGINSAPESISRLAI